MFIVPVPLYLKRRAYFTVLAHYFSVLYLLVSSFVLNVRRLFLVVLEMFYDHGRFLQVLQILVFLYIFHLCQNCVFFCAVLRCHSSTQLHQVLKVLTSSHSSNIFSDKYFKVCSLLQIMWNDLSQVIKSFRMCVQMGVCDLCHLLAMCAVFASMCNVKVGRFMVRKRNDNTVFSCAVNRHFFSWKKKG